MALEQGISRNWMRRLVLPGLLATALCAPIALDASANDDVIRRPNAQPGHVQPVQTPPEHEARPVSRDKMGNFDVQELMNRSTRSEHLSTDVQKKKDDSKDNINGKVG